jgi:RecQ family ATP-dependent DNA helicase
MTLLNHELGDDEYESVIISGLAVLGFRDDGGWLNAEDYTTKYSGVIKIARMLVIYRSYVEREVGYEGNRQFWDDAQARSRTEPMFDIVRRRVRKFMTLVSDKGRPTPMDWIFECRTYGMKIRYNTTAEGVLEWEGNKVLYQGIRFNMEQLRGMMHGLVEETRRDLMDLMMLEMNAEGEVEEGLPPIDWERLSDIPSEEKVGWSFLKDVQNKFAVDGKWWLLKRISHEPRLQQEWFQEDIEGQDHPYQAKAVQEYQQKVEQFQEKLLLIMHMVGGQPARATELLGMRYANTKQGGLRNIFIDHGMVAFVTTYHKNYRQTGKMKIIHRYLPREVGELLLRYLWLVLPFWQSIQSVIEKADKLSPFIWSDAIEKDGKDGDGQANELDSSRDQGHESEEPNFKAMHRSKQWTSERIRKIMQKYSEKWLGVRLNISAWRHIAIGIARRYLSGKFVVDEDEEVDWETFDEDNLDGDSPWDLQAGHGTHVAGMIYARELRQAPGQTMRRQDMFRQVSQEWHKFLQFASSIQGFGVKAGMKRPRSEWEHIGREVQFRRFKQMCHVNIQGKLKELMGETAEFRGSQEKTIHAIMTGKSPIVSIMATGEGKSLLFMLPAYCISGGTTIVIIPLCSLQEDLERRCREARIECVQWDSRRPHETASIVLVTPESVVTKTFSTYINRLRSTYQLDRVVIDECHVVLDSGPDFRPKLRALGVEMVQMGTQLIFLTATLPPQDEEDFFRTMCIPQECVHMFRSPTSRRNIRYQVQEVEGEMVIKAICQLVERKLEKYPAPSKIVIYGGSVEQTEAIGEALRCPIYHRSVDDRAGKARRMKELREGKHRVIVATNALGMGVDLPDIRVVIHAGQPRKLRDYAQESGRAGRDGKSSEAIIICGPVENRQSSHRPKSWAKSSEDIFDFIAGYICRRVIMDQIMDGRMDRVRCEEGEEQCDVCQRSQGMDLPMSLLPASSPNIVRASQEGLPTSRNNEGLISSDVRFGDSGIGKSMSSQVQESTMPSSPPNMPSSPVSEDGGFMNQSPIPGRFQTSQDNMEMQRIFEQQQRERQWLASIITRQCQEEGQEIVEFEEQLRKWANRCPLCKLQKRQDQWHRLEDCAQPELESILYGVQTMTKEIQGKKRFAKFSCCFDCGVPQAICQKWKQKDEQGWFEKVKGIECQYKGVLISVVVVIWEERDSSKTGFIWKWMEDDSVDCDNLEEVYKWFGQKVMWGRVEATNLCRVFHRVTRMVDIEQG